MDKSQNGSASEGTSSTSGSVRQFDVLNLNTVACLFCGEKYERKPHHGAPSMSFVRDACGWIESHSEFCKPNASHEARSKTGDD